MGLENFIFDVCIYHKRYTPKVNSFKYRSYFVSLNMNELHNAKNLFFGINKHRLMSFFDKDHGHRSTQQSKIWATNTLNQYDITFDNLVLITMPRVLGYVFNPVSFWLAIKNNKIIATIIEVNNTYGETHSYICSNNSQPITKECWFKTNKVLHVSPFFSREGFYKFNLDINLKNKAKNRIIINYYDNDESLLLTTTVNGHLIKLTKWTTFKQFIKTPLVTLKVISLIYYQAFKLFSKKIKFLPKPNQKQIKVTKANYINKI